MAAAPRPSSVGGRVADVAPDEDPLAALREGVRNARAAAQRLAREGTGGSSPPPRAAGGAGGAPSSGGGDRTPPMGWESPSERRDSAELHALVELLESLRAVLPDDLRDQLNDLLRQVLLLLRALIDWLVARIDSPEPGREPPIEDIPIG